MAISKGIWLGSCWEDWVEKKKKRSAMWKQQKQSVRMMPGEWACPRGGQGLAWWWGGVRMAEEDGEEEEGEALGEEVGVVETQGSV